MGEFMVTPSKVGAQPLCKTAEELLPLMAAEEEESDDGDDDEEDQLEKSLGGEDEENFKPLDLNVSTDRLGGWEEHTKGIGSRLMLSMGWQAGSGLGKAGGGRVDPVEARIYPQGKSLDWCMEKRKELGESSVEKVVRDEAKDAERKSKRRAEAERRRDESAKSLFDFINVKLRSGTGINIDPNHGKRKSKNGFSNNKRTESVPLKEETSKNLKIRQFELGESITRVEKEISKYRESHARLKVKDPKSAATVQGKLEAKMVELRKLQQKELRLKQEEGSRSASQVGGEDGGAEKVAAEGVEVEAGGGEQECQVQVGHLLITLCANVTSRGNNHIVVQYMPFHLGPQRIDEHYLCTNSF